MYNVEIRLNTTKEAKGIEMIGVYGSYCKPCILFDTMENAENFLDELKVSQNNRKIYSSNYGFFQFECELEHFIVTTETWRRAI